MRYEIDNIADQIIRHVRNAKQLFADNELDQALIALRFVEDQLKAVTYQYGIYEEHKANGEIQTTYERADPLEN